MSWSRTMRRRRKRESPGEYSGVLESKVSTATVALAPGGLVSHFIWVRVDTTEVTRLRALIESVSSVEVREIVEDGQPIVEASTSCDARFCEVVDLVAAYIGHDGASS